MYLQGAVKRGRLKQSKTLGFLLHLLIPRIDLCCDHIKISHPVSKFTGNFLFFMPCRMFICK